MLLSVFFCMLLLFFKQKTAYEMRISDWSSDVCSSDLPISAGGRMPLAARRAACDGGCLVSPADGRCEACRAAVAPPRRRPARPSAAREIGRASCRERVCQYV